MFGEKKIVGCAELTVSSKLKIPLFTYVKSNDRLIFLYDGNKNRIVLINQLTMKKILKRLLEHSAKKNSDRSSFCLKYQKALRIFMHHIFLGEGKVNSKNEIELPPKVLDKLPIGTKIFVIGKDNHLDIYESEKAFSLSLKK